MDLKKELKKLENKRKSLIKKDIDLIIVDYDDTIFSTKELIEKDYREWRRWKEWNDFILENNLINKIIKEVYENKKYPSVIASKLRENHDLILTAWIEKFQQEKAKVTDLEHINMIVVDNASEKVLETIRYVVEDLWFIPSKIIIYEDRPKFFINNKELIESFLWTKLEIMFVEMLDNEGEPKISKVN